MKKMYAFVVAALMLAGCDESPFATYRVGEACDLKEMEALYGERSVSDVFFADSDYECSEVKFEKDGAMMSVTVSKEGKIIEVGAVIPCESLEEMKRIFPDLTERLKGIYKDKLADCGAQESAVQISINGYENPYQIVVTCRDLHFAKLLNTANASR